MPTPEGLLITKWREVKGLTQAVVAERCEVEPKTISRYEKGKSRLTMKTLEKVAAALRVPGRDTATRLGFFFLGPEADRLQRAAEDVRDAETDYREKGREFVDWLASRGRKK